MPYSELLVKPMREDLTEVGFEELMSADDVDRFMGRIKALPCWQSTLCAAARLGWRVPGRVWR
jgi:putative YphP/YqiW family bacilliredoxin